MFPTFPTEIRFRSCCTVFAPYYVLCCTITVFASILNINFVIAAISSSSAELTVCYSDLSLSMQGVLRSQLQTANEETEIKKRYGGPHLLLYLD